MRFFDDVLMLLREARCQAGVTQETKILTSQESEKAWTWLQRSCFEQRFMINQKLKREITVLDSDPESLRRAQKKRVRHARRVTFKAWKKSLFGNTPLVHAILEHGIFGMEDVTEFISTYLQMATEKESSDGAHLAAEGDVTLKPNPDCLRREAVAARRWLKFARKCSTRSRLNDEERRLVARLESGQLDKICVQKNKAYGFGVGTPRPIPQHEAVRFRIACNRSPRD